MKLNEKIEIMLGRRRLRKTDFAESVGITYRAFANYMSGSRRPKRDILERIAKELDLTPEFLLDDDKDIELTLEERFIKRTCASEQDKARAMQIFADTRGLFAGNSLSDDDKEALLNCLVEIYNDSIRQKSDKEI